MFIKHQISILDFWRITLNTGAMSAEKTNMLNNIILQYYYYCLKKIKNNLLTPNF